MNKIPLCSFWSKDKLIQRHEEIGERAFDRGFRQMAITEGELTFPHFVKCLRYGEGMPQWQHCFTGVDLSGEKRKGNIIVTSGLDIRGKKYVIDIQSGNWSSPETAEKIKDVYLKLKPHTIYVENNAYQQSILDWMKTKEFKDIPVTSYTTGKQKSDPEIGLPGLDVQFERDQWAFYMPEHDVGCRCAWCCFVREMKGHPGYESTDYVMAFWFSERAMQKGMYRTGIQDLTLNVEKPLTSGLRSKKW